MISKKQLSCCALCQITAGDEDSIESINTQIEQLKEEAKLEWNPGDRTSGERAAFVIVSPGETILASNLKKLGFEPITEFNRRNGYPKTGLLTMWFLKW